MRNARVAQAPKLTRQERNEVIRNRLVRAAADVVGELGYDEASVARITDRAGVALGTFYNHFDNRQELLDELLPTLGLGMVNYIQRNTDANASEAEQEFARFRAFFGYLDENPGFPRILNEAEFSAPEAFHRHVDNMSGPYQRLLRRARDKGAVRGFSDEELDAVVHILMGARSYLSQRNHASGDHALSHDVIFSTYEKLLTGGLFAQPDAD